MNPNAIHFPINPISLGSLPTPEQHIRSQLMKEFRLNKSLVSFLHKYYLLHWSGEYFQKQFYTKGGRISHQGEEYIMVFIDEPRTILSAPKVQLSFRKLYSTDAHGYVLILPAPAPELAPSLPDTSLNSTS